MTLPIGRYAAYGPPVPEEMEDTAPLRILRLEELSERNGLGEATFLVDALTWEPKDMPIKLIISANPHSGEITRAAIRLYPGVGFVATDIACIPGNLVDLIRTILLDPRESA